MTLQEHLAARNAETQAWVAAEPGRWATTLTEDVAYWNGLGIETPADLDALFEAETYSDAYKEAHGFRPIAGRRAAFAAMTADEKREELDSLYAMIADSIECDRVYDERIAAELAEQAKLDNDAWSHMLGEHDERGFDPLEDL